MEETEATQQALLQKYLSQDNDENYQVHGDPAYIASIQNPTTTDKENETNTKTPTIQSANISDTTNVTAGSPKNQGDTSVVDYAGQVVANPQSAWDESNSLSSSVANQVGDAAQMGPTPVLQAQKAQTTTVNNATKTNANGYNVKTTQQDVANNQMQAAQGTVGQNSTIKDVPQADTTGIATGINEDGSVNVLGQKLQEYASQNISNIIDTSTSAGKLLAQQLGEGNYTDSKATLVGQLEILQKQFVDPTTGEPVIPSWAAGTARNVAKIAAFSGMTGTAATAAMSQAILEASIPIAQSDASFFQTLTIKNLDNKQQSTINAANVLAKFEQTNLDNRMSAAVQSAQAFLAMDMANLDNEQQAAIINNQARIQSILSDANAENVKGQFMAQSQNELDQFYASLNTQIDQYNASSLNDTSKFNATMEEARHKFYSEMNYNVSVANANWRQQVQLQDDQQAYEAATVDVKNMVDLSVNQLNQLWDRSDSLLDYAWQSSEKEKDRQAAIAMAKLKGSQDAHGATMGAIGTVVGSFVGSDSFDSMLGKLF